MSDEILLEDEEQKKAMAGLGEDEDAAAAGPSFTPRGGRGKGFPQL